MVSLGLGFNFRRPIRSLGSGDVLRIRASPRNPGMVKHPRVGQVLRSLMENQTHDKLYVQYNHTDACKYSRWTARECYEFMYSRQWQHIHDFYSIAVNGLMSLSGLFGTERTLSTDTLIHGDAEIVEASDKSVSVSDTKKDRTGRWARVTFKIVLSYHGGSFDGWQKQPGLNTVQGLVERSLGNFVDDKKAQLLKDRGLPIEGGALVAGRTDKGVTALQQVCAFSGLKVEGPNCKLVYSLRKDVKPRDVEDAINAAAPGKLIVKSVDKVSRVFHPNFTAKWRRYLYIFPLNDGDLGEQSSESEEDFESSNPVENHGNQTYKCAEHIHEENTENLLENDDVEIDNRKKPTRFRVSKVNQLLHQLEGKLLSYKMFARDTKASRNIGPPTECFIYHARATEAILPCSVKKDGKVIKVMCVELVANRFLRKMVRVLVATAIREAAAGAEEDALLKLMEATCRRATAPPAPPDGLCLVDVGYSEFEPQKCLIS